MRVPGPVVPLVLLLVLAIPSASFAQAGSDSTGGGNITLLDVNPALRNSTWHGVVGEASNASLVPVSINATPGNLSALTINTGSADYAVVTGIFLLFSNSSTPITSLSPGSLTLLDAFINRDVENGTNTLVFTGIFETGSFGTIGGVPTAYTRAANQTSFRMGYLQDQNGNIVIITQVVADRPGFNGSAFDFQFMLPTNNGTPTMYYLTVDIRGTKQNVTPPSRPPRGGGGGAQVPANVTKPPGPGPGPGPGPLPNVTPCMSELYCDDWGPCIDGYRRQACRDLKGCTDMEVYRIEPCIIPPINVTPPVPGAIPIYIIPPQPTEECCVPAALLLFILFVLLLLYRKKRKWPTIPWMRPVNFVFFFSIFAMSQLINITHVDGIADDFSNMVLEVASENETSIVPYEITSMEPGRWAVANVSVPGGEYGLSVLAAGGSGSLAPSYSPEILEISYFSGLSPDFSNLAIFFTGPDGAMTRIPYSFIGHEDGKWAIVSLQRAPSDGETVSVFIEQPDGEAVSGTQQTANGSQQPAVVPAPLNETLNQTEAGNGWLPGTQNGTQNPKPETGNVEPATPGHAGSGAANASWLCQPGVQLPDSLDAIILGCGRDARPSGHEFLPLSFHGSEASITAEAYNLLAANASVRLIVETERGRPFSFSDGNATMISSLSPRNFHVFEMGKSSLPALMRAGAKRIYMDTPMEASLSESIPLIRADAAQEMLALTGNGVAVCLLDTGVNYVDQQFGGMALPAYDFVNGDPDPSDDNGHGTRMASIIHAVAPNATILSVKVLDSAGHGYSSDIIRGIDLCRQLAETQNIRVLSMSFGGGSFTGYCDSDPLAAAVQDAYAGGILPVASSGNGGLQAVALPACAMNATAVASTTKADEISSFSNINPMVDMLAPGEGITVRGPSGPEAVSGTSVSAAHLAGAAALLIESAPALGPGDLTYRFRTTGKMIGYGGSTYPRADVFNAVLNNVTGEPSGPPANGTNGTYEGGFNTSQWGLGNWAYRQQVNFSVPSGATEPGFQVRVVLNASNVGAGWNWTNECVNSNSSRMRFINASDNAELDFWVENCSVANQNMTVWVEVDQPINTTGYVAYLYYSNPSATPKSDGQATFIIFDDFSDNSLSPNWSTVDADLIAGTAFTETAQQLNITADGADTWTGNDEYGAVFRNITGNFTATVKVLYQQATDGWAKAGIMVKNNMSASGSSTGYAFSVVTPSNGWDCQYDSDANGFLDAYANSGTSSYPTYLRLDKNGTTLSGYYSTDGATWNLRNTASLASVNTTRQHVGMAMTSHSGGTLGTVGFDNFIARKFYSVMPSYSMLGGQQSGLYNITLNATSPNNYSTDNLTCNYNLSAGATAAAVAWNRNSTPLMLLYMPFEGNSSNALLDYSGRGNNATNSGAAWNSTGGYNGTAGMSFPGGSYLTGPDFRFPFGNFTISLWFRTNTTGQGWLVGKASDTNYYMNVNDGSIGYINFGVYDGATYAEVFTDVGATNGQWHHGVMRVNGTHVEAIVDGVSRGTAAHDGTLNVGAGSLTIGGATGYMNFNGTIDNVRIYNYTLTDGEVAALFQNRSNTIPSQRLAPGDTWQCRVTPFSLTEAGATMASNNVTINPAVPSANISVQRGTLAMTVLRQNVSISAVNTSRAFILLSTLASNNGPAVLHVTAKFVNSTAIQFDKFSATSTTIKWQVVEGPMFSVQWGEYVTAATTDAAYNATINAVDLGNSFIIITDRINTTTANQNNRGFWSGNFTNTTAIQLRRATTGTNATVVWQVVSFSGATVQAGSIAATSSPATVDISPVNLSQSFIIFSRRAVTAVNGRDTMVQGYFINTTRAAFRRFGTTGTTTVEYFIVSSPNMTVTSGNYWYTGSNAAQNIPVPYANLSRSFTLNSWDANDSGNNYQRDFVTNDLASANNLQLQKATAADAVNNTWFLVDFRVPLYSPPAISLVSPTDGNGTTVLRNYVLANVTATPEFLYNITIFLYNSSGSLVNSTINNTSPLFVNFSGLADGYYLLNATACNVQLFCGSTETRNVTVHAQPPQWSDAAANETTIYWNTSVSFNATWTNGALAGYIFSINQSGSWANSSYVTFTGQQNVSRNVSLINASAGTFVAWYFWANDTVNNRNQTDLFNFTVQARPTALDFSVNQSVYPQLNGNLSIPSYILFNVRYADLVGGGTPGGAACNVTDNETGTTVALAYNSTTGNYTGQMNAINLYGNVTFTANCSLANYVPAYNTTDARVALFFYLWEDLNRSYGQSNYSTTWLKLDPPAGPLYVLQGSASAPAGSSLFSDFHVCGLGANCTISRDYLVTDIGTLRLNVSVNDSACKPYMCYFFKDASLNKFLEECTPEFTLTPNTPTLIERNATIGTSLSQGNYLGMSLYINCTTARSVKVNVSYNYSGEPASMIIWSPEPMPITATAVALLQLDAGYVLGPNQTLNASRRAVILLNNTGSTAKNTTYYWQTKVQPQYASSIIPNSTDVFNSTGALWASDNASAGAPYWAITYPTNQVSWITENIPAGSAVNETVEPHLLNAIRDNETALSASGTRISWNITVFTIFTPAIRADNVTVWTNYSAYGVPEGWVFAANATNSSGTFDISGSLAVNSTAKTITFPAASVNDTVYYSVSASANLTPPNVTIVSPLGGTYEAGSSVSIAVNASDPDGIDKAIAQVTLPNGTMENWTMDFGQQSDSFGSDTLGTYWLLEDSAVGGQSCSASINGAAAGMASTAISGDGSPESDGFCSIVSMKALDGDFDINISFEITSGTGPLPDSAVNFLVSDKPSYTNADKMVLIALANWSGYQREYEVLADDNNFSAYLTWADSGLNYRETDDTTGKLRIMRTGNIFTFYTWNSSSGSWTFENVTPNEFNMPRAVYVIFNAESAYSSWSALNVSWGNFSVSNSGLRFAPFNQTSLLGTYNVTVFVNDTLGGMNDSERTNFTTVFVNQPPSVPWLLTPFPGDYVGGTYDIIWSQVTDPNGDSFQFNITLLNPDGSYNATIVSNYGNSSTVSYPWNTAAYPDGNYSLRIAATENATAENHSVSYTLEGNFTLDNAPPQVNFTSPSPPNYDIVSGGTRTINVTASDSALSQLYIYVDSVLAHTCTSSPCTYSWNTSAVSDGLHRLQGAADDQVGNANFTETRTVWVFNATYPSIVNLTFNATSPYNYTTDNLTCSYALNSTSITGAITFYRNGNTVTPLYMPFEGGPAGALLDLSGNQHNVTNVNAVWNATGGYNNTGAFMFNGVDSYLRVNSSTYLNISSRLSLTAWVYPRSHIGYDRIVAKSHTSNGYPWTTYGLLIAPPYDGNASARNTTRMEVNIGGTQYVLNGNVTIPLNEWSLLGATFNGSVMRVYLNDALVGEMAVGGSIETNSQNVTIGADAFAGNMFNGSIDDVRIYNYAIPLERMSALYNNRTNVLSSSAIRAGDVWQCAVTPFSNATAGPTYLSGTVTVVSVPPLISNLVLNATSPDNFTADNLTCNYNLAGIANTSAVAWYSNNTPRMAFYLPFDGNSSADYSGNNYPTYMNVNASINASGGYYGGAYQNTGQGGYLVINDSRT